MSKNSIAIIAFLILLVIFINAFSNSYTSHNISNLAYIIALGIDKGEKAKIRLTAQFTNVSTSSNTSFSSNDAGEIVLVSAEADSIFSALNLVNSYIGKEVNLAHCGVIIFSEEFAKEGISTEIYSLINNEEVRPSTNLIVSTCDASEYLENAKPSLEGLTKKYFDTFSIISKYTGYISNITIGDFYNDFSSKTCDSTAILGGLNLTAREEKNNTSESSSSSSSNDSSDSSESSSETNLDVNLENTPDVETNPENLTAGTSSVIGKKSVENIGLAVFKDDKFIGELTATESICHLLITNDIDSCIITIDSPLKKDSKIEMQIVPNKKSKISADIKDDKVKISISLVLNSDILTLEDNTDYQSQEVLSKISDATESYLKKQIEDYLNKVSKEYNANIDHFCFYVFKHFTTISEFEDFDWKNKFKDVEFDVTIDVNVFSSLLITKT